MAKNSKKILIVGDSFSSIWPDTTTGWPSLVANDYIVTNLSQPGIGEYKILKQLKDAPVDNYDLTIVSHTSPSRIHTLNHPIHKGGFHKNCDLIYTDIEDRWSLFNENLTVSKKWFEYHYDDEYQIDIYNLVRAEIQRLINTKYLSITHTEISSNLTVEQNYIDFSNIWKDHRGNINHYTDHGNQLVYKELKEAINTL